MSESSPGKAARGLLRAADRATLATAGEGGWPYASLVLAAADHDGSPLLFLSDLAEHTRNLTRDPRVSLLIDGTAGLDDPMTGARVTLMGRAERADDPRLQARYAARHPDSASYVDFHDFAVYRIALERARLIAGFGKIHWVKAPALTIASAPALAEAEPAIVAHMNEDHADALAVCMQALLGREGEGWRMTGIDPEGCDLRRGGSVARLEFDRPVTDAESARAALVALVRRARGTPAVR